MLDTALSIPGTVSEIALTLPPGLPYDVWARTGERLRDIFKAWNWWFGDYLNYGEDEYPDEFSQMFDVVDMPYSTIMNIKSVAKRVPPELRRSELSWGHHEAVAKLEPAVMDSMLQQAVDERWTREHTRQEVKLLEGKTPTCSCHCHNGDGCRCQITNS